MRKRNKKNLKTEKKGIRILKSLLKGFIVPTTEEKKYLYNILNINYKTYFRSIDGILLNNVNDINSVKSSKDFYLVEIKTTEKKTVKELPYDVFFGITKNEENLFKKITNYRLCIVHVLLKKYKFVTYKEYESLIQNKRIQYQVNFRKKIIQNK